MARPEGHHWTVANNGQYDIFTRTKTFDSLGWRVSSFEFPHNLVHALSVCNGTFSDINWSAFDPILYVVMSLA